MPTLRHLRCEVEWGNTKTPFPEYGTTYGDGLVETYIPIPNHPQPFAIHLRSTKYIAEGLAMLVFMDGEYQCNRNRLGLQRPNPGVPQNMTEIDLRVRQRERALGKGNYLGREWRFDKHNTVPVDRLPPNVDRRHFDDLGTIDVFVLRCRPKDDVEPNLAALSDVDDSILKSAEPSSKTLTEAPALPSNAEESQMTESEPDLFLGTMNDGAAEIHQFGLDGEGPGPAEQKAWSWNAPHPPSTAPGPPSTYAPAQPPPAHIQPYAGYGYPPGFPQPWQPGPAISQDQSNDRRPQRRVHFNDQLPQQPPNYGAPGPPYGPQSFSCQSQEKEHPPQSGNYGQAPQTGFHHQVPGHVPVQDHYANPSLSHTGIPSTQEYGRGYSLAPDLTYPPPMPNYPNTTPSYQPIGYGAPPYYGWPTTAGYLPYTQPNWQGQNVPGSSYLTPPNYAASYQPSHPYPYPQSAYPIAPTTQVPAAVSIHPGGGVWGPPPAQPGSQDSVKDGTNQLDGQSNQNQNGTINAGGQPNDNNSQEWAADNTNQAQAGDSSWNNNDTGGGQPNSWNNTGTQTEPPTNKLNQSSNNTDHVNNPDSSWNDNTNNTNEVQTSWNNNANSAPNQDWNANNTQTQDWNANANANTSTEVQGSWNTAPVTAQTNQPSSTSPQRGTTASLAQGRPLNGPHGPYYGNPHTYVDESLRPDAGEEPPYDVPEDISTTHQVKTGPGFHYVHKRRSPEYIDTLDDPYARFIFKYRTKEQIEKATGIKIEDEPTGDEEKMKLQKLDKNEIIDILLRARTSLGGDVPPPPVSEKPDGSSVGIAEPIAIPAPTYHFLDYSAPTAQSVNSLPTAGNNAGLGVSMPAPVPAPAPALARANSLTHDWSANNDWANKNTAAPQQPTTANAWNAPEPAAPQHQPQSQFQPQFQSQAQTQPQSQPRPSPQSQPQQAQQAQQPPVAPIQIDPNVQIYRPNAPATSPMGGATTWGPAGGRPTTPPHGGWNAAQTVAGSNASDNGMAGWGHSQTGGGSVSGGGGRGWGGSVAGSVGGAAPPPVPDGGW